jgi:hypothetical protein
MSKLTSFISKVGENPLFIAFMAHAGFAYFVVSLFSGTHQYIAACVCLLAFGLKEFWYDIKYEQNPPQTFIDSSEDFIGYVIGIIIALTLAYLKL